MTDEVPEAEDSDSFGSLAEDGLDNLGEDLDEDIEDNWIEELECALLAECDPSTLKKICEGKKIPANLRADYWKTLLSLNDTEKVKLTNEFDLFNQDVLRRDCDLLVEEISTKYSTKPMQDTDKLKLRSDFESTLTTYVKARPELEYTTANGWTDVLKVLHSVHLNDVQMYQMFFRIVDRYIPKDLSPTKARISQPNPNHQKSAPTSDAKHPLSAKDHDYGPQTKHNTDKSVQAYHLLRLLIQYHDPELCSILDSRKVTPNLYVRDWFCSLFSRSCSPDLALQIWDMHFKMADPFLIFFAAIVMVVNASDDLKKKNMSQQDMLEVLKLMPSKLQEDDIEDLYYLVSNHYTYTTPRSIRSYSHLFFMDTFGNTYSGNDSPDREGSPTFVDTKTAHLTSTIDLSRYLCLPIVPAEIFAIETARTSSQVDSSPDSSATNSANQSLRYFLVDCRPAEQYNAGHLNKAFHLDCSLMLREPSSFATAVQALLEIQQQVVASKSETGGQHLCFIGSGQEEEDQYVNMVVASFLQKYQKYVSIVSGGFDAIHDYVKTKSELCDSFSKYIVDHDESLCKSCNSGSGDSLEKLKQRAELAMSANKSNIQSVGSLSSTLFATTSSFFKSDKSAGVGRMSASNSQATASMLAQSSASMFDKFTTAFVSKSNIIKDRLVETINANAIPNSAYARSHVSDQDKLGPRYTGSRSSISEDSRRVSSSLVGRADESKAGLLTVNVDHTPGQPLIEEEPCQEVQVDAWVKENDIMAIYKCAQIKGVNRYPGFVALNKTHLWILREIPHNKGFASIAAKRPLDMVVQITSKRKQPDFIIFRYGYAHGKDQTGQSHSPASSVRSNEEARPGGDQGRQDSDDASAAGPNRAPPTIVASDNLHIPQAFEVIRLIKREVVRIMDEASRRDETQAAIVSQPGKSEAESERLEREAVQESPMQASSEVALPIDVEEREEGKLSTPKSDADLIESNLGQDKQECRSRDADEHTSTHSSDGVSQIKAAIEINK